MLIIGYVFAIRSERAICRDVQVNLAYRWFCGLSIEDKIPDHSAFSRARHERFRDSDMFRRVFERVVEACIAAGLVGDEGFAVDASLIVADANKQRSIPGSEWNKAHDPHGASRAMREYLANPRQFARKCRYLAAPVSKRASVVRRRTISIAMPLSGLPSRWPGKTYSPVLAAASASKMAVARFDNATRCSRPLFMRTAGTVGELAGPAVSNGDIGWVVPGSKTGKPTIRRIHTQAARNFRVRRGSRGTRVHKQRAVGRPVL
jgi:hypothetical protein